jgi:hypothetical protein
MYIPVSTATIALSNISKKIKEIKEINKEHNKYHKDVSQMVLILGLSTIIFLIVILYKIHTTKVKRF